MVDSRLKGAKAETDVVKALTLATGHQFKRIPMSGALDAIHGLKGDVYIPNSLNIYCIEVKHYKDCHLTSNMLTDKMPQMQEWWEQTVREAAQISRKPLLIFKHDRSKLFVGFKEMPSANYNYMFISMNGHEFYVSKLEDWLSNENPKFC